MANKIQDEEILYNINAIRQILFFINEPLISQGKDVVSSINAKTGFNLESNLYNLTLRVLFHHNDDSRELAVTEVENVFFIQDLKKHLNEKDELVFPKILYVQLVGLAISHTRALFTQRLAGTALQNVLIAIMNPYEAAKSFFPKSFENEVKAKAAIVNAKLRKSVSKK
jgi:hypothetical protein